MASKIEEMIVDLQDYIDNCKSATFKADSIIVNRDEIESYIEDLRANIPDEIRQYQRIINNQEHILADARKKADAIIKDAEIQKDQLVSEHQIMNQAFARANEVVMLASKEAEQILDNANTEANEIKFSAIEYTDTQLKIIQEIMTSTMEATKSKADSYITQMQGYLDIVTSNRNELAPSVQSFDSNSYVEEEKKDVPLESVSYDSANESNKYSEGTSSDNTNTDDKDSDSGIDVPDVFFNKE